MRRDVVVIVGVGVALAAGLAGLVAALRSGRLSDGSAALIATSVLVVVSYAYASLAWLGLRQSREAAVRPVLVLDLIYVGEDRVGCGIRVANCGLGPAMEVTFEIEKEPSEARFKVSPLAAVSDGFPVLPPHEDRVVAIGQHYSDLEQQPDPVYVIRARYKSLDGSTFANRFLLKPQPDPHLIRSSRGIHRDSVR